MLEPAAESGLGARAFLRIGGLTVARQQLALALALQCERIVCIAPALTNPIVELQHLAERAGAHFHVIPGARPLVGLVTATDELIVLADGLFASTAEACDLLSDGQSVLVQPIEQGLAAGFERIDLNHAGAGAMRLPGRLAERLGDLPADCDAVSTLQRIALQAGVRQRAIPAAGQDGLFWTLVRSDAEAHAIEPLWIRQRTRDADPLGPSRALALLGVRGFGPAMLHAGTGGNVMLIAALASLLLALGAGWFGFVAAGLGLCALGWLLREMASLLLRIERDEAATHKRIDALGLYAWTIDGALIVLLAWATLGGGGSKFLASLFPPFMLIALLRVLSALPTGRWSGWLSDRGLAALALMGATLGGVASQAAHIGASLAAIAAIVLVRAKNRLTRP
ncbi:MAG: hypothetical protein K2W91_03225 [Novosphingobium sp.]|nr:hypothetical protein [Novosphingobium sp.]